MYKYSEAGRGGGGLSRSARALSLDFGGVCLSVADQTAGSESGPSGTCCLAALPAFLPSPPLSLPRSPVQSPPTSSLSLLCSAAEFGGLGGKKQGEEISSSCSSRLASPAAPPQPSKRRQRVCSPLSVSSSPPGGILLLRRRLRRSVWPPPPPPAPDTLHSRRQRKPGREKKAQRSNKAALVHSIGCGRQQVSKKNAGVHRVLGQGRRRSSRRTPRRHASPWQGRRRQVPHLPAQGHGAQVLRLRIQQQAAVQGRGEPVVQGQPLPPQQPPRRVPGRHRRLGLRVGRCRRGLRLREDGGVGGGREIRAAAAVGGAQGRAWLPAARQEPERELDTEHRGGGRGGRRGGGGCAGGGPRTAGVDGAGGARRADHLRLHPRRRRQRPQAHPLQPRDVQQVGGAAVVGGELRPRGGALQRADVQPAAGRLHADVLRRRRHAERFVVLLPRGFDEGEPGDPAAAGGGGRPGAADRPRHVVQGDGRGGLHGASRVQPVVDGRAGPFGPRVGAPLQPAQLRSRARVRAGRPALRPVARHDVVPGRGVRVREQRQRPGGRGVGGAGRARRVHHHPRVRRRHPRAPPRPLQPREVWRGQGKGVVGAEQGQNTRAVPVTPR